MTPFLTIALMVARFLFGSVAPEASHNWPLYTGATHYMDRTQPNPDYARVDTLRAGQTFITNLPDSLAGESVLRYRGVSLPKLSWLFERSFFWRTKADDAGEHTFWFKATLESEREDSISVRVVLE